MKKFIFLPEEMQIKAFQNEWFLSEHIALVLQSNLRNCPSRFESKSIFDDRCTSYRTTTRVAKVWKEEAPSGYSLVMQTLKPCLNNLDFVGYHIGNKGCVVDKEDGRVVCIVEGDFEIIGIKEGEKSCFAITDGNTTTIVKKNNINDYSKEDGDIADAHEKPVEQNGETSYVHNIKANTYSWKACFLRKYIAKNIEAIEAW